MGVIIPNFASSTEDRASGAQVIDGSLKFDESIETHLTRTATGGNRKTFTVSCWFKKTMADSTNSRIIMFGGPNGDDTYPLYFENTQRLKSAHYQGGYHYEIVTNARLDDYSGWYHFVSITDTAAASSSDRIKLYINGELQTSLETASYPSLNYDTSINENGVAQCIGFQTTSNAFELDGYLSQFYFIDGQALDASYFGYTDGLTGTWRPKKFNITDAPTADWGTNGFYLPFDGSAPIGQDQSGKGNDWTPVNFRGTHSIEKATGALPILNTISGGNVAVPRPRGNAGVAVTVYDDGGGNKYYLDGAKTGSLDFVRGQTVTFNTGDSTVSGHPFRFSPKVNGTHGTTDYSVDFDGNDRLIIPASSDLSMTTTDFTFEAWVYPTNYGEIVGAFNANPNYKGWLFSLDFDSSNGKMAVFISGGGSTSNHQSNSVVPTGQWSHVVLTKSGTTYTFFLNGLKDGSFTSSISIQDSTQNVNIGADTNTTPGRYLTGKISNLRIVQGTVVYTSNFTPPTEPLTNITNTKLLCCNNSSVTGATVTPGTITTGGDPASSTDTPYDTYSFGVVTGAISPGTVGAATTITFPHNAPDSLYYYCTNHSGMGGSGTIGLGTDMHKADPYAWKNTLALPLIGNAKDNSNNVNTNIASKSVTVTNAVASYTQSNFYGGSYSFDGNGDYLSLSSTSDFDFDKGDFTIELWANCDSYSGSPYLFDFRTSGSDTGTTNKIVWYVPSSSGKPTFWANGSSRIVADNTITLDAWTHLALVRENGTTTMYIDGSAQSSTYSDSIDYGSSPLTIGQRQGTSSQSWDGFLQDVRIYKGIAKYTSDFIPASTKPDIVQDSPSGTVYDSALEKPVNGAVSFGKDGTSYLTAGSSSDFTMGTGDFTVECWINLAAYNNAGIFQISSAAGGFTSTGFNNTITVWIVDQGFWKYNANGSEKVTTIVPSLRMWHHVALVRNSGTTSLYVNGILLKSDTDTTNYDGTYIGIGGYYSTTYLIDGLISNFRVVKGTALYTEDFVPSTKPLTNVTNTKLLCCNSNSSATSATVTPGTITASGTKSLPSSFNPFDISIDRVLGEGSDYCILNNNDNGDATITDAGTYFTANASGGTTGSNVTGTIGMPLNSGKYYWEYTLAGGSASGVYGIGYGSVANITALSNLAGAGVKIYGYSPNGNKYENASATSYGKAITVGTTISVLFDSDTRELEFWWNGTSQGVAYTVAVPDRSREYVPMIHGNDSSGGAGPAQVRGNFGQQPFKFIPTEGYKTLNTKNLPVSIARPDTFASCVLWTGNTTLTQINIGYQPDLVWGYYRTAGNNLYWADSVRGRNAFIYSTSDSNETTNNQVIDSVYFNDTGFRVGTDNALNASGGTMMAWCFKAGGQKNTFNIDDVGYATAAAAGLDGGDIDPTAASVGTRQGLSIIKYTGNGSSSQTIAHGLGKTPSQVVVKRLTGGSGNTGDWMMSGEGLSGWDYYMVPNKTQAEFNDFAPFGTPTSSLFTVGSSDRVNNNTDSYIAYVWSNITGVQKFGGYTGNGNTNGAFIYTGFRPAMLIVKVITSGQSERWYMWDNKRDTYNSVYKYKDWGDGMAEQTGTDPIVYFVSDGFKFKNGTSNFWNGAYNYVYMAWAESPLSNLYGGQANAR